MLIAITRSEAAKKASETRKRNRYEQMREERIQSARRDYLYNKLSSEQRADIEAQLDSATCDFDEELENWFQEKEEAAKEVLRGLLRKSVSYVTILAAIETDNVRTTASTGRGGCSFNLSDLLYDVTREKEFLGMNQTTSEEQQRMWALTDTVLGKSEMEGMDESEYDIPLPYEEMLAANAKA